MTNIFKKRLILILIIAFSCVTAAKIFALEVNKSELENPQVTNADKIVFKNYTGPVSVIQTRDQISGIGSYIGGNIAKDVYNSSTFSYSPKYKIIHAVNPKIKEKLDADIVVLSEGAGVDHIKNLRLIISSYLSKAYGYSKEDSDTLAVFITVYNAVYRGNLEVFTEKYKESVTKYLVQEKVGLSQNYQDWPGKTQIVIPLSDLSGGISTIDTSLISDQTVVDSMRETDSKGVDERKNMLDLKNREADQAETQAKENQLQYEKNEEKIAESEKQLEQEKQEESELKEQIEQDKQNLENAENNEEKQEAQEKLSEDEKKLSEKQEEIARTEQDIEEIKSENQSLKASSQEKQSFADKKRDEASSDTENIAKDQKDVIDTKNKNDAVKNAIYGLKLNDEKLKTSSIVKIDSDTGRIISESEIDVIRGRIFYENNDEFICIAGINSGNGAVKLVSIDKEAMTISISSELSVYEDSVFVQSQGFYFVVVQNQDGYKLAKFDSTLNICALSEIEVNPNTPAIITEKGIIAQDKSGTIIIFDEKTLLTK